MDSIHPGFIITIYGFISELLLMFIEAGGQIDTGLHMMTSVQTPSVFVGGSTEMECQVYSSARFNLFVNPIVWYKRQLDEVTSINMMGNIQEPFASTNRLKVTFKEAHPNYHFGLSVSGAMPADSGNYTCAINGPQNAVLISVTHQLVIRAPVERVILSTGDHQPSETDLSLLRDEHTLTFDERRPVPLRCTAIGGYPPPAVEIYVDGQKVGDDYAVNLTVGLSGNKGLRLMNYTTTRWKQDFTREAEDDGKYVKCVVAVAGMADQTASAAVSVRYSAVIICDNSSSYVGERNVFLRCEISARPPIRRLLWVIDNNGTTIKDGEVNREPYWVFQMERTDGVTETQLFIRQTNVNCFRTYELIVENDVGIVRKDVSLKLRYEATLRPPKTFLVQSSHQDFRSSGFSFLQNSADAVISHVTTFDQLLTHLTITCLARSLLRQPWWAIIDDL